jgi:hypothetical protein
LGFELRQLGFGAEGPAGRATQPHHLGLELLHLVLDGFGRLTSGVPALGVRATSGKVVPQASIFRAGVGQLLPKPGVGLDLENDRRRQSG